MSGPKSRRATRALALTAIALLVALAAFREPLARWKLAVQVVDQLRRPGEPAWITRSTPAPRESAIVLRHGRHAFVADLYRPGGAASRVPILFVPGLVETGKDDPAVPPFARLLARAGFPVVVPNLPSFLTTRVHPDQAREMAAALGALVADPALAPAGRAGLFGVSYAGGIALLTALDPAHARRAAFVVAVGAYADLESTLVFLATGRVFEDGRMRRVRTEPYGQLVFLRTFEEFLPDPRDHQVLEAMVSRRMANPAAPLGDLAARLSPPGRTVHDLFERTPADSVPAVLRRLPPPLRERLGQLSPARRPFTALAVPLYLVHARNDGTFPVTDSHANAERARPHVPVRLVVLDALQHVEPEPWRKDLRGFLTRDLPEAARLTGWWYRLLGERRRE